MNIFISKNYVSGSGYFRPHNNRNIDFAMACLKIYVLKVSLSSVEPY